MAVVPDVLAPCKRRAIALHLQWGFIVPEQALSSLTFPFATIHYLSISLFFFSLVCILLSLFTLEGTASLPLPKTVVWLTLPHSAGHRILILYSFRCAPPYTTTTFCPPTDSAVCRREGRTELHFLLSPLQDLAGAGLLPPKFYLIL